MLDLYILYESYFFPCAAMTCDSYCIEQPSYTERKSAVDALTLCEHHKSGWTLPVISDADMISVIREVTQEYVHCH